MADKKKKPGTPAVSRCGYGWGGTKIAKHPGLQHFCKWDSGHHGSHVCILCGESG